MKNRRPQVINNISLGSPVKKIVDEGNYFSILAELPGVEEEKIRINLENDMLTLQWVDKMMKFQEKEIFLPCRVRLSNKKFQNGKLEISLEKIDN